MLVAPLPPAPCYGHIPVHGEIPPSPSSPFCLQLGSLSCRLHTFLCLLPKVPCKSLQRAQGRTELMACGQVGWSCERQGCGSTRTGAPAPGSEVALQEQALTQ